MVIADFHGGFQAIWMARFPERDVIELEERRSFYLTKDYDPRYEADIEEIINAEGFLRGLAPIQGAIEGFQELRSRYDSVKVCTTSLKNPFSLKEKWEWVLENLGVQVAKEMIVCNDKTLIKGAYLIDDKPVMDGAALPDWRYIIYDQPYNRRVAGPRLVWGNDLDLETLCSKY